MRIIYQGVRRDTLHRDYHLEVVGNQVRAYGTRGGRPFDFIIKPPLPQRGLNCLFNLIEKELKQMEAMDDETA